MVLDDSQVHTIGILNDEPRGQAKLGYSRGREDRILYLNNVSFTKLTAGNLTVGMFDSQDKFVCRRTEPINSTVVVLVNTRQILGDRINRNGLRICEHDFLSGRLTTFHEGVSQRAL